MQSKHSTVLLYPLYPLYYCSSPLNLMLLIWTHKRKNFYLFQYNLLNKKKKKKEGSPKEFHTIELKQNVPILRVSTNQRLEVLSQSGLNKCSKTMSNKIYQQSLQLQELFEFRVDHLLQNLCTSRSSEATSIIHNCCHMCSQAQLHRFSKSWTTQPCMWPQYF